MNYFMYFWQIAECVQPHIDSYMETKTPEKPTEPIDKKENPGC